MAWLFHWLRMNIYTQNLKHKNRKQSTQNTKIGDNPRIRGLQQKYKTILELAQNTKIGNNPRIRELQKIGSYN